MSSEHENNQGITRGELRKRAWNDLKFRLWSIQDTVRDPLYRGIKVRFVKSTLSDIAKDAKEIVWPKRRR